MKQSLRITIGTKLSVGFGVLASMVLIVAGVSLHALSSMTDQFEQYIHGIDTRAQLAAQVRMAVDSRAIAARNLVLVSNAQDVQLEKANVNQADADVRAKLQQLNQLIATQPGVSDHARELVAEINRVESLYGPVARDIEATALANQHDLAVQKIDDKCRPLLAQLIAATEAYADDAHAQQERSIQATADTYYRERNWMLVAALAAAALACCAGYFISRSITRPIRQAAVLASAVAQGDLRNRIEVRGNDETRDLLQALQQMNEKLQAVVSRVRTNSSGIVGSASEIASGNMDLSQRTEQQAASLEETAASMEELTSTVKQNAENAQQANALAATASDIARRGNEAVGRVVSTMDAISQSSAKIADITAIIEGISFQTNILALNAAVEAARAGEQGRGFAVVASEVRSLAQRSATAAKEIKELITQSVQKVEDGSKIAVDAGKTIGEVTQAVTRVTDIIAEIAAAAGEQSRGLDQINQAVTQMDNVTQQNAALVEEAAAASQSLEIQGRELSQEVAFFRIGDEGGSAASTASVASTVGQAVERRPKARTKIASAARKPGIGGMQPALAMAVAGAGNQGWETF
jgi:methyl-accepting chemotaxis protein-1 (serine sensor receptor)